MNNFESLSLENIRDGEAIQRVNFELQKVLENCIDLNTDAKAPRTVTLKIKIIPTAERDKAAISFQATATLAPDSAGEDQIYISPKGKAFVNTAKQTSFDDFVEHVDEDGVVTKIPKERTVE